MSACRNAARTCRIPWLVVIACGLAACMQPARRPVATAPPAAPVAAPAVPPAPAPAPAAAPAVAPPVAVAPPPAAPPAPPPPPPVLPYEEAVLSAANNLLGKAQLPADGGPRFPVVIDPLVDGMTGTQTTTTRAMGERLTALIREKYPQYEVLPFNTLSVSKSPLVLIGTFTGVNAERKTEGTREAYRICFALADLKSGKLVSKGLAFAKPEGVDPTPTGPFRDAPAWNEDPATLGYIRTCQGTRAGDPIHPLYVDRILAASMISEAMDAYSAGKYADALALYETVARTPAGQQMRTYTGLYLTNWRLGRKEAAAKAFGQVVEQGLESKRLGVKFLFRPGSVAFFNDARTALSTPYPMWLGELSAQAAKRQSCLEVVGHTSATGPEPVNERLSLLRAEYVKGQIERLAPPLAPRLIANGVGSRQTLIGNGRDDASDALDRRVEFKVVGC